MKNVSKTGAVSRKCVKLTCQLYIHLENYFEKHAEWEAVCRHVRTQTPMRLVNYPIWQAVRTRPPKL